MIEPFIDILCWVDDRVFWADKKHMYGRHDGQLLQTDSDTAPRRLWEECIELTFEGAAWKDHFAIYDQMFDNHAYNSAVIRSFDDAKKMVHKIKEDSKICLTLNINYL